MAAQQSSAGVVLASQVAGSPGNSGRPHGEVPAGGVEAAEPGHPPPGREGRHAGQVQSQARTPHRPALPSLEVLLRLPVLLRTTPRSLFFSCIHQNLPRVFQLSEDPDQI